MLKPFLKYQNNQTSFNKAPNKSTKQENSQTSIQLSKFIPTHSDKISIFDSSSIHTPTTDQQTKYQLLSAENNTILLKKLKSIPVHCY
jgi:hypothetical protein